MEIISMLFEKKDYFIVKEEKDGYNVLLCINKKTSLYDELLSHEVIVTISEKGDYPTKGYLMQINHDNLNLEKSVNGIDLIKLIRDPDNIEESFTNNDLSWNLQKKIKSVYLSFKDKLCKEINKTNDEFLEHYKDFQGFNKRLNLLKNK
jgi:hypothetical protein